MGDTSYRTRCATRPRYALTLFISGEPGAIRHAMELAPATSALPPHPTRYAEGADNIKTRPPPTLPPQAVGNPLSTIAPAMDGTNGACKGLFGMGSGMRFQNKGPQPPAIREIV
jgi:hypothetical protein